MKLDHTPASCVEMKYLEGVELPLSFFVYSIESYS